MGRLGCVSEDSLDLMNKIFKYEPERIKMEQILAHPFLKEQAAMHSADLKASAAKDLVRKPMVSESTTQQSVNDKEHEAGQVLSHQHESGQSSSIGVGLDYVFKSEVAKKYVARLQC